MTVDWDKVAEKLAIANKAMNEAVTASTPKAGKADEELALLAEEIQDVRTRVNDAATNATSSAACA